MRRSNNRDWKIIRRVVQDVVDDWLWAEEPEYRPGYKEKLLADVIDRLWRIQDKQNRLMVMEGRDIRPLELYFSDIRAIRRLMSWAIQERVYRTKDSLELIREAMRLRMDEKKFGRIDVEDYPPC